MSWLDLYYYGRERQQNLLAEARRVSRVHEAGGLRSRDRTCSSGIRRVVAEFLLRVGLAAHRLPVRWRAAAHGCADA